MRIAPNGSDVAGRRTSVAMIVCWNHIVDHQQAAELRQRETADGGESASPGGPPRPTTVIAIEQQEALSYREAGRERRSRKVLGCGANITKSASANTFCSDTAGDDEKFPPNRAGGTQPEREESEDNETSPTFRNLSCGSARLGEFHAMSCSSFQEQESVSVPTYQDLPRYAPSTRGNIGHCVKEASSLLASDSISCTTPANFLPLTAGAETTDEGVADAVCCTSYSFGSDTGDVEENTRGKKRSLNDVIASRPSQMPAFASLVTPIAVESTHLTATFPYYADAPTFLSTPSPPMERQRRVEQWCRSSIFSSFSRTGFGELEDRRAGSATVCVNCGCETLRRPSTSYELPVLNAEDVDELLE